MSELARETWEAICNETAQGGDKTSEELIDAALTTARTDAIGEAIESLPEVGVTWDSDGIEQWVDGHTYKSIAITTLEQLKEKGTK